MSFIISNMKSRLQS